MTLEEVIKYRQLEAIERVNKLVLLMYEDDRLDDYLKSAKDPEYQEELFKEYGLK